MKILITGANSYIGTSFENYIKKFDGYEVETIDMIDGSWKEKDFSDYDTVFHVAGIAHADTGKADDETKARYYKVNTDLAVETAEKAKSDGVKQFVFMSSIIVFGSKNECITKDAIPEPDNFYGDSKLQADIKLQKLQSDSFNVASIRPPMIYGKGSKGNYPKLSKLAKMTPIFPKYENKRSMLFIGNLCEFLRLIIKNNECGIFYPQNKEYSSTTEMVKLIANIYKKRILIISGFSWMITFFVRSSVFLKKIFGNLYYDQSMSIYKEEYRKFDIRKTIELTECVK